MRVVEVEASAEALTFDDLACLSADSILSRLLRTRGLGSPETSERPEPVSAPVVTPCSILVVEDEPDLLKTIHDMLARKGYRVVAARTGEEAMVQFARTEFAVVVTDLVMPGLNGLEVARRCKQARPGVAVVMVTAWDSLLTEDDITRHGVDRVLAKPLRAAVLLETITDVTRRR